MTTKPRRYTPALATIEYLQVCALAFSRIVLAA